MRFEIGKLRGGFAAGLHKIQATRSPDAGCSSELITPAWRPDAQAHRPAGRIAGWKRLFQAFVDIGLRGRIVAWISERRIEVLLLFVQDTPGRRAAGTDG